MKFFSINKALAPVITTIIVIISLGAVYFFIYLPHNEKTLREQHFRTLKTIDENIHSKVENSVALLNNLIRAYNAQRIDTTGINDYISRYPKDKFILTPISKIPQAKDTNSNTGHRFQACILPATVLASIKTATSGSWGAWMMS
jgi:hypothetical protein